MIIFINYQKIINLNFFIKELNKYNNKTMGQSNIMKYRMQKAT